ncbi:MAG: undecaprenyldiphospho-muramoylpentapeptide beta-N-acetylglucosaminyltransferase [Spirochaetia bacterium]
MSNSIIVTGGGTAGHVFPALAVIERLKKKKDLEFLWIGSANGVEREIVGKEDIPFLSIPCGKLRRYFDLRTIFMPFQVFAGIIVSIIHLLKYKPSLVFSKGGYVSVPPVIAAKILRIPAITHESDVDPGLATKINSRFADIICVSYKETKGRLPEKLRKKVKITGNPVRRAIFEGKPDKGRALFSVPRGMPVLLVVGGSSGALELNQYVYDNISQWSKYFFVIHQTGGAEKRSYRGENYSCKDFFSEEYPDILAAADLVLSRSGASAVWECIVLQKPAVFVPLGRGSSRGDQYRNARTVADTGAAVVVEDDQRTSGFIGELVKELMESDKDRKKMQEIYRSLLYNNASDEISEILIQRIGE